MPELAEVFRLHGPAYLAKYHKRLLPSHRRVMQDVVACRTEALSGHVFRCPQCQQHQYVYHSCKNRHCAKCQNDQADRWLAQKQDLLLPVPYFMVTFTLPSRLRALVRSNQKDLYNLLFRASSASLQKLAQDPKYVGGMLGMLGVLQTWTRDMRYHPHIHYLIPGGGLAEDGKTWREAKGDFLMPRKPLAKIFRAKFRDGLKALGCYDRVPTKLWRQDWVVDIEPVGSGKEILKYLTPYIFRVALSNKNILSVDDKEVTFRYRDSTTKRLKTVTLPAERFIHRFLQHVLPKGLQKVRTYGLYHPKQRHKLELVKEQLKTKESVPQSADSPTRKDRSPGLPHFRCPQCQVPMICIGKLTRKRGPPTWP